jgi:hypothetical protein
MALGFVGRGAELTSLQRRLERTASSGEGTAVALRGRRQVGKSRLVQEFCDRAGSPYLFFTATKGEPPVEAVARFCTTLQESALPRDPELVSVVQNGNWLDGFRTLATALPDAPAIVVIDQVPWLAEQDQQFDGALQTGWDRLLRTRPVLLLLLGSDLHMMERLTAYDRPFYGRADNLVLGPLNVAETGQALGLEAADAIDAQLVSGGLPGIVSTWPHGAPALPFIERECEDPASSLFSVPESVLLAEFPSPDLARRVLETVGSGNRTQANIAASAGSRSGGLPSGSLSPLLRRLVAGKRILAIDEPLSTQPGKPALYRVADSNLRLYLGALREAQDLVRRGQPTVAYQLVERRWTAWRGRAVEPLVRASLEVALAAGDLPWPEARTVGGWWNRQFTPELDLVGADRGPVARQIFFAGAIKWLGTSFDNRDLAKLASEAAQVPGFAAGMGGLVVVSRSGVTADHGRIDVRWQPRDVVQAWSAAGMSQDHQS